MGCRCGEHDHSAGGCKYFTTYLEQSLRNPTQVVLAKEAGLLYAAIAMPTDYDCWKEGQVVDVTAVMEVI